MSAEIKKVYKEHFPPLRLIGKKYSDADRVNGSFGEKWGQWFQNGWFDAIEKLGVAEENTDAYFGAMRFQNGEFEYWIGMFFPENTSAPEGFAFADIPAFDVLTCWIYGNEKNGELFGMDAHNLCLAQLGEQGMKCKEDGWFLEKYNCPRFTSPDEKGNVILDYCIPVE